MSYFDPSDCNCTDCDWIFGETLLEHIERIAAERADLKAAIAQQELTDLRVAAATDLEVTAAITIQQVCSAWFRERYEQQLARETAAGLLEDFHYWYQDWPDDPDNYSIVYLQDWPEDPDHYDIVH